MPRRESTSGRVLALTLISVLTHPVLAQTTPAAPAVRDRVVTYVKRGAPVRRVSAGVRGHSDVTLDRQVVALLAPHDHIAWTANPQPDLYWRFAGRSEQVSRVLLIVARGTRADTLALPRPEPGLQRVALAQTPLRFQRGIDSRWSVVVRFTDTARPDASDDAWIRVVTGMTPQSAAADPVTTAQSAAASGLWYDAFAALTSQSTHAPDDESLLSLWRTFLVGTVPGLTPPPLRATIPTP